MIGKQWVQPARVTKFLDSYMEQCLEGGHDFAVSSKLARAFCTPGQYWNAHQMGVYIKALYDDGKGTPEFRNWYLDRTNPSKPPAPPSEARAPIPSDREHRLQLRVTGLEDAARKLEERARIAEESDLNSRAEVNRLRSSGCDDELDAIKVRYAALEKQLIAARKVPVEADAKAIDAKRGMARERRVLEDKNGEQAREIATLRAQCETAERAAEELETENQEQQAEIDGLKNELSQALSRQLAEPVPEPRTGKLVKLPRSPRSTPSLVPQAPPSRPAPAPPLEDDDTMDHLHALVTRGTLTAAQAWELARKKSS